MKKKLIEIPTELFDKIVRLATENDRSVNKQINHLLKSAVGKAECCDICKEESMKGNKVNKICTNCIKENY